MMDAELPKHVNYWMTSSSKHDCFFNVGPECGPKERVGAIQIILTGQSEVFRKMLEESPLAEKGDIKINDTDPETFRNFLKCIYGGTDVIIGKRCFEECLNLLYLCEKYQTLDLKENISCSILKRYQPLTVENVLESLLCPVCLESKEMTKAIADVIQNHTRDILDNKLFLDLGSKAVEFIVKQNKISIQEVDLWTPVLNWAKKKADSEDPKELRSFLGNILKYIRFCAMESDDFCTKVIPSGVLTQKEVFEVCKSIGTATPPKLDHRICCEITSRTKISHESCITKVIYIYRISASGSILFQVDIFSYHFIIELTRVTYYDPPDSDDYYNDFCYYPDEDEEPPKQKLCLKLTCSCTGSRNRSPWKCFVKVKMSVGSCKHCKCILSKSFSTEISCTKSSQDFGTFISDDQLKAVTGIFGSLEIVSNFEVKDL